MAEHIADGTGEGNVAGVNSSNRLLVDSTTFNLEVAKGNIPGHSNESVFGVNPLVGTSFEDIWDAGGNLVYPTAGETWEIASSNTNDTSAGTGARTVAVTYLDDAYVEQTEVKTMNGTTAVTFTAMDAFRFKRAIVLTAGSEAINAGDITVRVSGGGATRGQINTGNGNSLDGHFTVPAGKTAFLVFVFNNINKNEDIQMKLLSTIGTGKVFSHRFFLSSYQSSVVSEVILPAPFTEKSDLKLVGKSTNTNAIGVGSLQFVLVDN